MNNQEGRKEKLLFMTEILNHRKNPKNPSILSVVNREKHVALVAT